LQAALLLKSQVQAVQQEVFEKDSDIDVAELIGQAVNLEKYVYLLKNIKQQILCVCVFL
jgi:hypothetical protein